MSQQVRVEGFTVSLDGFGAGPDQSADQPLGVGGEALHGWLVATRTFHQITGADGGSTGTDDDFAARGFRDVGAWVMGRNMFGPVRGPWPDDSWKGWWGDAPPYHCPVFVLTRHPRAPVEMAGGTVFHFVTDGLDEALRRARDAAGGKDVRVGGGVFTIQQALRAGRIDAMHVAVAPVLLGAGERLFDGVNLVALGYEVAERVATPAATHVVFRKTAGPRR